MKNLLNKVLSKLFWKVHLYWKGHHQRTKMAELENFDIDLLPAISRIESQAGIPSPISAIQMSEYLNALLTHKPQQVVELGSGRSTMVLAAYAKASSASIASFEQSSKWCEIVNGAASDVFSIEPVQLSELRLLKSGGRYCIDIPLQTDFIYLDGPLIESHDTSGNLFGKSVYFDVIDFLDRGGRPKIIVCEGRLDSVESIRAHRAIMAEYKFVPSFFWYYFQSKLQNPFVYNWHSTFVRLEGDQA